MGKIADWFESVLDSGKTVGTEIMTTGKNEAVASALALIFGAKPNYSVLEDGKTHFYWQGQNLVTAQETVKAMTKGNPNSTVSIDFLPVIMPLVISKLAPLVGVGILIKVMAGKK